MTNEREKMRTHSTPPTPLLFVSGYFALRFSLHIHDLFIVASGHLFIVAATRENPTSKPRNLKKSLQRVERSIGFPVSLKRSSSGSSDGSRCVHPLEKPWERPYWESHRPACKSARALVRVFIRITVFLLGWSKRLTIEAIRRAGGVHRVCCSSR